MFTVSSLLLHISEKDEQILSSLGSSQKAQGKDNWGGQGEGGGLWSLGPTIALMILPRIPGTQLISSASSVGSGRKHAVLSVRYWIV